MSATRERIERLHDVATALEGASTEPEIFERAVTGAADVLDLDGCAFMRAASGTFEPAAAVAPALHPDADPLAADAGVAGRTLTADESIRVPDLQADADAVPTTDSYRSALSIPVDDDVVFQAFSTTPNGFSETDREVAEMLVTYVEHARNRVSYEALVTQERDRFAALFENVPDAAIQYHIADGVPVIDRVNSAFVRLFGYEPDTAVGERVPALLVPDGDRDAADELHASVDAGDRIDAEVTRETESGTRRFLLRSVPVAGDDDERTGYFIYTDITPLKERERELERQNERLDAFTSVVSHDLRNPLSVAEGYADLAQETGDLEHLAEVTTQLERMETMIEELLSLARQGDVVGAVEPVSLGETARVAWGHVETGDATLTVRDAVELSADPARMLELLENLFRNAIEHGGEDVTVTVGALDAEPGFFVADDGVGIPAAERDRVLEMGFSTADDGTGFGLGIVTEIVRAHGWSIAVTEAESGGARFEVRTDPHA